MNGQAFAPNKPEGYRIPDNKPKDWFSYPVRFQNVATGDIDTVNMQIDAGSDFFLTALTFFATLAATPVTLATLQVPQVTILLTDSGSNRQLMNSAVPLFLIAGDGNHPHRLIHPRLFQRNSNIQVVMNSLDADTYTNIWVNLEGFRIYQ